MSETKSQDDEGHAEHRYDHREPLYAASEPGR
jgi:hypothetical protein